MRGGAGMGEVCVLGCVGARVREGVCGCMWVRGVHGSLWISNWGEYSMPRLIQTLDNWASQLIGSD